MCGQPRFGKIGPLGRHGYQHRTRRRTEPPTRCEFDAAPSFDTFIRRRPSLSVGGSVASTFDEEMKSRIALLLLIFGAAVIGQDSDPFSDAIETEDPPPRDIPSMPASITYERVDDKMHRYTIAGIYNASQRAKEEQKRNREKESGRGEIAADPFAPDGESGLPDEYPESIYEGAVPDCDEFTVDFETRKCTFSTSRKLTLPELVDAINQMAWMGGDIPYWSELEARDIVRSNRFNSANYIVEESKEDFPPNLAWFWAPADRRISTLIGVSEVEQGQLIFTPTTAHCMAHSRFAIRVFDPDGRLLWRDDSIALASVRFAVADIDRDGLHDILLDRDDHGRASRFLIRRNIE